MFSVCFYTYIAEYYEELWQFGSDRIGLVQWLWYATEQCSILH